MKHPITTTAMAIAGGVALTLSASGFASASASASTSGSAGTAGTTAASSNHGGGHSSTSVAKPDSYLVTEGKALSSRGSVLDNDSGSGTIVSHTDPAHGALTFGQDGSFRYQPAAGFTGVDTFSYTTNDAVKLYDTDLPPLATIGGVKITGGAYGSSFTPVPGSKNEFYGLTDRGPNVTAPDGTTKIEPLPTFDPAIGKFRLVGSQAILEKKIPLKAGNGTPYNGLVSTEASTGETIEDLSGKVLPKSPYGYDSEGLVAMKDGTFWVSDEYGPYITHFAANGRQIARLSPFDGSLPKELAQRVPNKGMEGLTITPDGRTLVGIVQSALQTPDLTAAAAKVAPLRIVTYDLKTHATHEYLYLLTDPATNAGAVSEITALSNTKFVVDERDGNFEPNAFKRLYAIDLTGATDVGPNAKVHGAKYVASKGGLLVGPSNASIEAYAGTDDTQDATTALAKVGIRPVSKKLDVDLGALVTKLDPTGGFFGHDKVEGVATADGGKTLIVSNDNDFGIDGVANQSAPYTLHAKILPDGTQDDGQYLAIDTTKLNDANSTTTVSVFVTPPDIHK